MTGVEDSQTAMPASLWILY